MDMTEFVLIIISTSVTLKVPLKVKIVTLHPEHSTRDQNP